MFPTSIAQRYKTVQVKTSTPGELLLMLYEGVFRFVGEAATAMRAGDRARAGERISRAHAILGELISSLRPKQMPELCDQLLGVYRFCMAHMVQANLDQDPLKLDAVLRILTPLRDAWKEAVHAAQIAR